MNDETNILLTTIMNAHKTLSDGIINASLTDKIKVMGKIKIKQVKSGIDRPQRQKDTLYALGLRKMNQVVEV